MRQKLQLQFRNTTNDLESADPGHVGSWQNGFEVRRTKLGFDGSLRCWRHFSV